MELYNDRGYNRLKIISKDDSTDKCNGALVVNGGLGVRKNINCLGIKADTLTIDKEFKVDLLAPKDDTSDIGKTTDRFKNVYANNVDTNCIYVNSNVVACNVKTNTLEVCKTAKLGGDDNCNSLLDINKNDINFNSLIRYKYQNENVCCANYNLYPKASIILINTNCCANITLMTKAGTLCTCTLGDGTFVKIYNRSNNSITINSVKVDVNCCIEFLFTINCWIALNNSPCNTSNNNCNDDCSSSLFTVHNSNCC